MDLKVLLATKTREYQALVAQLQSLENQRTALIQEILRAEGALKLLQELDGVKDEKSLISDSQPAQPRT